MSSCSRYTDGVSTHVNQVVASSEHKAPHKNLQHYLQDVQKYFPDILHGNEFMEKISILEATIREYENIIQEQLESPARENGIILIEKQNREIEAMISEKNTEERNVKIYAKFREQLAELLLFLENNFPKEAEQCKNPNITV